MKQDYKTLIIYILVLFVVVLLIVLKKQQDHLSDLENGIIPKEEIQMVLDSLEKEKSSNTLKGDLIKSAFITSTMGVSYKLKLEKNI